MTYEKVILAQGTAMATRVDTLESATDFILRHDKTVEKFAKIEVLEKIVELHELSPNTYPDIIKDMIAELKAGN